MIRGMKSGWCPKCNHERPLAKLYLGAGARHRAWACVVCHERVSDPSKAWSAAVPARDATGVMRQSTSEARRGTDLLTQKNAGVITNLRFCNDHPRERFTLRVYGSQPVAALLEEVLDLVLNPLMDARWRDRLRARVTDVERAQHVIAHYTPDFSYDDDRGVHHVEDVKGRQHEHWPMKKALMLACHGIEVEIPNLKRESRRKKRTR